MTHHYSTTTFVGLIYGYLFASKFSTRSGHLNVSMETQKVNFMEDIKIHRLKAFKCFYNLYTYKYIRGVGRVAQSV
jgi:hypothetical protein